MFNQKLIPQIRATAHLPPPSNMIEQTSNMVERDLNIITSNANNNHNNFPQRTFPTNNNNNIFNRPAYNHPPYDKDFEVINPDIPPIHEQHILDTSECTVGYQKSVGRLFFEKLNRIISASSDWILMIYDSLDSSHQDASNCSVFMPLGSIVMELFAKIEKQENANNFPSINPKHM